MRANTTDWWWRTIWLFHCDFEADTAGPDSALPVSATDGDVPVPGYAAFRTNPPDAGGRCPAWGLSGGNIRVYNLPYGSAERRRVSGRRRRACLEYGCFPPPEHHIRQKRGNWPVGCRDIRECCQAGYCPGWFTVLSRVSVLGLFRVFRSGYSGSLVGVPDLDALGYRGARPCAGVSVHRQTPGERMGPGV